MLPNGGIARRRRALRTLRVLRSGPDTSNGNSLRIAVLGALHHGAAMSESRISYIDGLRALAVLSVVCFHAGVHNAAASTNLHTLEGTVLRQGCHGVDLFFILSGFCLAYPTLSRLRRERAEVLRVSSYAARRLVRIVPPYYFAIAMFAVLGYVTRVTHVAIPSVIDFSALTPIEILKQMAFLDRDRQFLNSSFWTLAIEFRWYFVFPVLLWLWVRSPKAFAALGVAMVAATSTRLNSVDVFFLPSFMLGIVAADAHVRRARYTRFALLAAPVALAAAIASTSHSGWYFDDNGPFWGVAMFILVAAAGSSMTLQRLLAAHWLVRIGTASYGIYLVHEPLVSFVENATALYLNPTASFAVAVGGAIAFGLAFSYVAERPFLAGRLRRALVAQLEMGIRPLWARLGVNDELRLEAMCDPALDEAA